MRLTLLCENAEIHLFHGTFIHNIKTILSDGLTSGDVGRSHFAPSINDAYQYEDPWAVVEVLTDGTNMASPIIGDLGDENDVEVRDFQQNMTKIGLSVSNMLAGARVDDTSNELRKTYWNLNSKLTKERGIGKECSLPLPIGFDGSTRIIAIYEVSGSNNVQLSKYNTRPRNGTITKIFYNEGGSYQIGDQFMLAYAIK